MPEPTPTGSTSILQTYSWQAALGGKDPATVITAMRELAARLVRIRPVLRGMRLEMTSTGRLHIELRVAGHTRWEIQRDARKLIIMFLRRVHILPTALELELVTTQRNGRELMLGEGRTPMGKRPRAARKADGTPWDDYEWWGDELPTSDHEEESPEGRDPPTGSSSAPEDHLGSSGKARTSGAQDVRELWEHWEHG